MKETALAESPAAQELRQAYRFQVLQAAIRERDLARAFAVLRAAGVEPLLVKGWAVARLYPECALRPYSDLDLYVRPAEYAAARTAFAVTGDWRSAIDLQPGPGGGHRAKSKEQRAKGRGREAKGWGSRPFAPCPLPPALCPLRNRREHHGGY